MIPFAVVGSERNVLIDGKQVRGRKNRWGVINIEDENHCEFVYLRNFLTRFVLSHIAFFHTSRNLIIILNFIKKNIGHTSKTSLRRLLKSIMRPSARSSYSHSRRTQRNNPVLPLQLRINLGISFLKSFFFCVNSSVSIPWCSRDCRTISHHLPPLFKELSWMFSCACSIFFSLPFDTLLFPFFYYNPNTILLLPPSEYFFLRYSDTPYTPFSHPGPSIHSFYYVCV